MEESSPKKRCMLFGLCKGKSHPPQNSRLFWFFRTLQFMYLKFLVIFSCKSSHHPAAWGDRTELPNKAVSVPEATPLSLGVARVGWLRFKLMKLSQQVCLPYRKSMVWMLTSWWQLKHFLCSPLPGYMIRFDSYFQMGWNHIWHLIFGWPYFQCFWMLVLGMWCFFKTSFVADAFSEIKTQMIPMYHIQILVWFGFDSGPNLQPWWWVIMEILC